MSNEKLVISDTFLKPIIQNMEEGLKNLESEGEIRKAFRHLEQAASRIKMVTEFEDSAENRMAAFLIWNMIKQADFLFSNRDDEWLEENRDDIEIMRREMQKYISGIKMSLQERSYEKVLIFTKDYFYAVRNVIKDLSRDFSITIG